jgi:peptidoglycan-N-acetylglucosamine deacetylase
MRRKFAAIRFLTVCLLASCISASLVGAAAAAPDCPNPNALGTSRTIAVDPNEHQRLGSFQYRETLPLNDREVVITFDDGPLSPFTPHILDTLAKECVKATFFMVGRMARTYPHLVKRVYAEGHTIGNHSQNHPFSFARMTVDHASREIEDGFASIRAALGEPSGVSRFFRIPGLLRQTPVENYLASRGYMTWSVDLMADDWTRISASEVVRRALERLDARGRGILLLHDIQPATALGLPTLLHELKARGYRIVHVVEASPDRPKTATLPEQWMARTATRTIQDGHWPLVNVASLTFPEPEPRLPDTRNFGISDRSGTYDFGIARADRLRGGDRDIRLPPTAIWRNSVRIVGLPLAEPLPAPDASNFRYANVWKARTMVARRSAPKGPTTAATVAPTPVSTPVSAPASAPKGAPPSAPKNHNVGPQSPRPPRPVGHQLQLPKPTASL